MVGGVVTETHGNGGFFGDGGLSIDATLRYPENVATASDGDIYFSDSQNYRIRKIDSETGIITTIAGTGEKAFDGDGGLAINAKIRSARELVFDKDGNLVFIDTESVRLRKINMTTGIISTIAGTGALGYTGDGGPATGATFNFPTALTI
jgi:hypothetical protein